MLGNGLAVLVRVPEVIGIIMIIKWTVVGTLWVRRVGGESNNVIEFVKTMMVDSWKTFVGFFRTGASR